MHASASRRMCVQELVRRNLQQSQLGQPCAILPRCTCKARAAHCCSWRLTCTIACDGTIFDAVQLQPHHAAAFPSFQGPHDRAALCTPLQRHVVSRHAMHELEQLQADKHVPHLDSMFRSISKSSEPCMHAGWLPQPMSLWQRLYNLVFNYPGGRFFRDRVLDDFLTPVW